MNTRMNKITITLISALLLSLLITTETLSQGITFSLANGAVTSNAGIDYYEFDIMVTADANSQFYIAQLYLNYNTAGFGTSAATNATITKGEITADTFDGAFPDFGAGSYTLTIVNNTATTLSIQNAHSYNMYGAYVGSGYELSNTLGTSVKVYAHIKMLITNPAVTSGIAIDKTVTGFDQQQYFYTTANSDATTKYSPVSVIGGLLDEPLPVEMTSFTVVATENNAIVLSWSTATEVNNYGFDVERASSSATPVETEWKKIGFIEGHGNSNSPKQYSFYDDSPLQGKSTYRLKQIDTDGAFEYSDEIEITIVPDEYELIQNYPNPFNPSTVISFNLPKMSNVKLTIYNAIGEKITELADKQFEAGSHSINFNGSQLSSGFYFYRLETQNYTQTKKMMLLK